MNTVKRTPSWKVVEVGTARECLVQKHADDLKRRTKQFALDVIKFVNVLPASGVGRFVGDHLLAAGASVAANYRSASRTKSRVDVVARLVVAEEEADASLFWMELLLESGAVRDVQVRPLMDEAGLILAQITAAINVARHVRGPLHS